MALAIYCPVHVYRVTCHGRPFRPMTSGPSKRVLVARSQQASLSQYSRLESAVPKPKAFMPERKEERAENLAIRFEGGEVAHNVSANGIYFTTDAAFRVGQPVKLTFEFSNSLGGPIAANCVARVVRPEERGPARRRCIDRQFRDASRRARQELQVMKGLRNEYGPGQASALDGGLRSAMAGASTA